EHRVQLWLVALDQLAEAQPQACDSLSADEQARAGRFHFELHRRRFIAGRFFLRALLGAYFGQPAGQVRFTYGVHGKPALQAPVAGLDVRFNLAHSDNLAVVGLALGRDLGVDVEHLNPLRDAEPIARRFFSPPERAEFEQLSPEQKLLGFYQCWTRKEAFIKALGDGLAYPLADFDVTLAPGQPACLLRVAGDPNEARHWSLVSFQPAPETIAALAIRQEQVGVDVYTYPGALRTRLPAAMDNLG
ncbi:MAG: 4'-phosphopantetheinyl transferase superfamily protein, partial [Anaerolineales bacterium]|nr:4'-phosphopantetheinyl transferase superfamily protein [Anaerolineales bacterium]